MKYLRNTKESYKFIMIFSLLLIGSVSCTDYMEDINFNQKLISDKQLEMDANEGGFVLPGMELGIVSVLSWPLYQMQTNLSVDNYAGYVSNPFAFLNNVNPATYAMVDNWNNKIMDCAFSQSAGSMGWDEKKGI